MSNSLWSHKLQHARLPCPSLFHWVCSNSCPLSQWWHPTISSSVTPLSSCPQSFPASWSFPVSQLFASGCQSIGASASVSVPPMNIQGWFPLGLTGVISLQSRGFSWVFFSTNIQKHQKRSAFFVVLPFLPDYWKNHSFDYTNKWLHLLLCFPICTTGQNSRSLWGLQAGPMPGPRPCSINVCTIIPAGGDSWRRGGLDGDESSWRGGPHVWLGQPHGPSGHQLWAGKARGLAVPRGPGPCVWAPQAPPGSLGAKRPWRSLPNGFLLPASSQDSSSIFCSVLPLGPRRKGRNLKA